jgi:hypothetical protein
MGEAVLSFCSHRLCSVSDPRQGRSQQILPKSAKKHLARNAIGTVAEVMGHHGQFSPENALGSLSTFNSPKTPVLHAANSA